MASSPLDISFRGNFYPVLSGELHAPQDTERRAFSPGRLAQLALKNGVVAIGPNADVEEGRVTSSYNPPWAQEIGVDVYGDLIVKPGTSSMGMIDTLALASPAGELMVFIDGDIVNINGGQYRIGPAGSDSLLVARAAVTATTQAFFERAASV